VLGSPVGRLGAWRNIFGADYLDRRAAHVLLGTGPSLLSETPWHIPPRMGDHVRAGLRPGAPGEICHDLLSAGVALAAIFDPDARALLRKPALWLGFAIAA